MNRFAPPTATVADVPIGQLRYRPQGWEILFAWLALLAGLINYVAIAVLIAVAPRGVLAGLNDGTISPVAFLIPLPWVIGAALLVRMQKLALPFLAGHVVLSVAYLLSRGGPSRLGGAQWVQYALDGLVLAFALNLWRQEKLV